MFQENLHVLFFIFALSKSQVDFFTGQFLFFPTQLFSVLFEIILDVAAMRCNVFFCDLSGLEVIEVLGKASWLIASELKWFLGCIDHWDIDEAVLIWYGHGWSSCEQGTLVRNNGDHARNSGCLSMSGFGPDFA